LFEQGSPSSGLGFGGAAYAEYIKDEEEHQEARKQSIEQRGVSVITTSGVLVTALFGLTALSTKKKPTFHLSHSAEILLIVALILFFLAAIAALFTNLPRSYRAVTPAGLRTAVDNRWDESVFEAQKMIAKTRLKTIRRSQELNQVKARVLAVSMALEAAAVAFVAAAVGITLTM
jgi:hypothetical protein